MKKINLGKTNLKVSRVGFGGLPIQRVSFTEAKKILLKAVDYGINFFDTAKIYHDSENKIGNAFKKIRSSVIIATKSNANNKKKLLSDLDVSLKNLQTDYIDLFQLHNPSEIPSIYDNEGLYQGLAEAKNSGKIRFFGLTNHSFSRTVDGIKSGLFDTIQYPISYISSQKDLTLIDKCKEKELGFIAMKPFSGGMLTNAAAAFAFLNQFENVIPIWGFEKESELDEVVGFEKKPPVLDEKLKELIKKDQKELSTQFCRGCEYCKPCPKNIDIPFGMRFPFLVKRFKKENILNKDTDAKMKMLQECINCKKCVKRCPYNLNIPSTLKKNYSYYCEL
jgi:aryl-alcohol dehydrogenase-like predicted oxidoreductase